MENILKFDECPKGFKSNKEYLTHLAEEGVKEKYENVTEEIKARLQYELDYIFEKEFENYFVLLWDLFQWSEENNVYLLCDDSWITSLLCYVLDITDVDPIRFDLYFNLFLNDEGRDYSRDYIYKDFKFRIRASDNGIQKTSIYLRNKYGERFYKSLEEKIVFDEFLELVYLQDAELLIRNKKGYSNFNLKKIPLDDEKILQNGFSKISPLLCHSEQVDMFLYQIKPKSIEEVIDINSCFYHNQSFNIFKYREKNKDSKFGNKVIDNILQQTNGVLLYDQQMIQIVQEVTGKSFHDAASIYNYYFYLYDKFEEKYLAAAKDKSNLELAQKVLDFFKYEVTCPLNTKYRIVNDVLLAYEHTYIENHFKEINDKLLPEYIRYITERNSKKENNKTRETVNPYRNIMQIDQEISLGRFPSVKRLMKLCEVSEASIIRYINTMKSDFNAPIEYDRANKGYYYTTETFRIPGMFANENQVIAIKMFGQFVETLRYNTPYYSDALNFFYSLSSSLDESSRISQENISRIVFADEYENNDDDKKWFVLEEAMKLNNCVTFDFIENNSLRTIRVAPFQLVYTNDEWNLYATDPIGKKFRLYKLSSMSNVEKEKETFELPKNFEYKN